MAKRGAPLGNKNAAGRRSTGGRVQKVSYVQWRRAMLRTSAYYRFASRGGTVSHMSVGGKRAV